MTGMTERTVRRLLFVTLTCIVLFVTGSEAAYAQRGYLAVGGEYVFCLIPLLVLGYEWLRGGE